MQCFTHELHDYFDGNIIVKGIIYNHWSLVPNIGMIWPDVDIYYWNYPIIPIECMKQFCQNVTFGILPLKCAEKNIIPELRYYSFAKINGSIIYCFLNTKFDLICHDKNFKIKLNKCMITKKNKLCYMYSAFHKIWCPKYEGDYIILADFFGP